MRKKGRVCNKIVNGVKRKVRILPSGRWRFLPMTKHRGKRCPKCHRKW